MLGSFIFHEFSGYEHKFETCFSFFLNVFLKVLQMVFLKELIEFSYEFPNFKNMIQKMVIVIQIFFFNDSHFFQLQ